MTTYPSGETTRYGRGMLLEGAVPQITYTSPDQKRVFHIQGGLAPMLGVQNGALLISASGFSPPFKHIDSQGAREDGVTWNDTVYDPAEIDVTIEAGADTPAGLGKVVRDWIAANDPKLPGRLEYFTPDMGLWWCDVRLNNTWPDIYKAVPRLQRKQVLTHTWRNDHAFWRSTDSTSTFAFAYDTVTDSFTTDYTDDENLGPDWPQYYTGDGGGYCTSNGDHAYWVDDPDDPLLTDGREVVNGPLANFDTDTDNQVINIVLGSIPEITFPDGAENHIWGRMGRDGDDWDGNGIKVQIGYGLVILSRYNNFTETVMAIRPILFPPFFGEKFTLVCGYEGNPRQFKVLRNGWEILSHKEAGTGSEMGSGFRGIGFGMRAGAALITQATPGIVRKISAGDNATVTQSGFCPLTNLGSENGWPRFLLYGPGTFQIGNGPSTTQMVEFGPLLDGQVVLIDTHPSMRAVVDLTPANIDTSQPLTPGQRFLDKLIDLVTFNRVPPLLTWFESLFGIRPPQGVLYSLLSGRFTRPVPGVPVPDEAVTSQIAVKVVNGNATTKIVAAVTPLRRYPE